MESKVKFYPETMKLIKEFENFKNDFRADIYAKMDADADHILIYYTDYDGKECCISAANFFDGIAGAMRILTRITRIKEDVEENDTIMI